jgi:hypothetical protein
VQNYTPANVNYEDFIKLTNVAYEHRKNKIVSFDEFLKIQKQT